MDADRKREWTRLAVFAGVFAALYFLPVGAARFDGAVSEALHMSRDYAREHLVLCLLPAFWISGAIAAFVSKASVLSYVGPKAHPAINVLAIVLTATVLGFELGAARAIAAIVFSIVRGLLMARIFRSEQAERTAAFAELPLEPEARPLWQTGLFFTSLVAILVFANWGDPKSSEGFFAAMHAVKWYVVAGAAVAFGFMCWRWIGLSLVHVALTGVAVAAAVLVAPAHPELAMLVGVAGLAFATAGRGGEAGQWFDETWSVTKLIFPLLVGGVLVAGLLLGRPGHEALVPSEWIARAVGGNSLGANFFAAFAGMLMYFATLTEVPIIQGLFGNGMGKDPALALMLAEPALSLPALLVLQSILGAKKTLTFAALVVVLATFTGWVFGFLATDTV